MIIVGVLVAVWLTGRRLRARGFDPVTATEAAYWAVPLGIVGARVYHVITSPDAYFGAHGDPVAVFQIWRGGLAIWGAIAGGALGAWLACRRAKVPFLVLADAAAPGLAAAQAVGRWGNWFNQELFGRPTDLPWAVRIDPAHQLVPGVSTYHPTFLYESLWDLGVAGALLAVDRRRRLGRGRLFALYVALYTAGRVWIEALRIDEAHKIFGLRVNIWVSILVFLAAVAAFAAVRHPADPDRAADAAPAVGEHGSSAASPTDHGSGAEGPAAAGPGANQGDGPDTVGKVTLT
jgi:prolipoprotein diacylglyceryl transferase